MDSIKPPEALLLTGNVDDKWKRFKQRFDIYWQATEPATPRPDSVKLNLLLHIAGADAIELFNTFTFTPPATGDYAGVLQKFEDYCSPKKNETHERYVFRNRLQQDGETIEQYVLDLKLKAKSCNYGTLQDSLIRDQVVFGIRDRKMKEKLLIIENLTLDRAIQLCQASETAQSQLKEWEGSKGMPSSATAQIYAVSRAQLQGVQSKAKGSSKWNKSQPRSPEVSNSHGIQKQIKCKRCGYSHELGKCPAFGKTCNKCKRPNHFSKQCKSKYNVMFVEAANSEAARNISPEDLFIDGIDVISAENELSVAKPNEWVVPVQFQENDAPLLFKVDTGAQIDLIPWDKYQSLVKKPSLKHNTLKLRAYGGYDIQTYGTIQVCITVNNQITESIMSVVESGAQPILGLKSSESLGLVKRTIDCIDKVENNLPLQVDKTTTESPFKKKVVESFPKLFEGIGCVKQKHTIRLKDDAVPVIQAPRRVPFPLKQPLKQELENLVEKGIIKKVDEPTDWVSSLVIVEKKEGKLRVCLDPRNLNENIKREHYQIPTRDELEAELAGAKYFSKLDAYSGFYQIPLDDDSALLCTFNSPYGRYCFVRLPFGISSAPEIFHKQMCQTFEGLEGVMVYLDDILVWGRTFKEHNRRLLQVLKRAEEHGITLNLHKCEFGKQEVEFLGDIISSEGIHAHPGKIEAICNMPRPQTKDDVHRALGMVTYMGKYIPNLSKNTVSLRSLLKKNVEMMWNPEHEKEWEYIKATLISKKVLTFYDPSKDIKLSTDASQHGLGAVLTQLEDNAWKPVAYASRSLTDAETRYSQIEKETLGLVFGCERFHSYIYGRQLVMETDHKPLISIVKKGIADTPPRLQRLFLRLLKYQFSLHYIPGKDLVLPDALSRAATLQVSPSSTEDEVQIHVDMVVRTLSLSEQKLNELRAETANDPVLKIVMQNIRDGWTKNELISSTYKAFKDELSVNNGIVFKGTKIVIPKSLRALMLEKIHEGHLGIEKCRARARQLLFWPGMSVDIANVIKLCSTCIRFQYRQQQEPLIMRQPADRPWDRVATDLFEYGGRVYVILYDSYSNYPEVERVNSTEAENIISVLKRMFGRHGIPTVVQSDNGPQYSAYQFKKFAKEYDFVHETSSPKYAQSNGLAEKGVQIIKRLLKKAIDSNTDYEKALLSYRSTPLECGSSPAELLMGRRLRTSMPMLYVKEAIPVLKKRQKKKGKLLKELKGNDTVRLHDGKDWKLQGQVLSTVAPRSYDVLTEDGSVLRRNRLHLLKTSEAFKKVSDLDLEENIPNEGDPEPCQQSDVLGPGIPNTENPPSTEALRRSTRVRKPPVRLNL